MDFVFGEEQLGFGDAAGGEHLGVGQTVAQRLGDSCRKTNVIVEDEHAELFSFCHGYKTGFPPIPKFTHVVTASTASATQSRRFAMPRGIS